MGKHMNYDTNKIIELYTTTSYSINQIAEITNISSSMVRYYIKKFNITRPDYLKETEKIQLMERRKNARLSKNNGQYFSDESLNKSKNTRLSKNNGQYFSDESNLKREMTNLSKYGTKNVLQNKSIYDKALNTKQDKYGNKFYNNREQAIKTRLNNYGNYFTKQMQIKSIETSQQKYGTDYYMQTEEYKHKAKQTRLDKNNGKYFNEDTIQKLSNAAKNHYNISKPKRIQNINYKYKSFNRCFYKNEKLLRILEQPEIRFIEYISQLEPNNRNFAYIENDLDISYTALLNYSHIYDFKDLLLNTRSHFQQNVIEFIKSLDVKYKENDRTQIHPLELDIYIPEHNVAIECNGNYWHSNEYIDKNYHYNKSRLCEEKGIRLIHIFEYEWENDRQRPILKNIIKNALNINTNKIYARKCKIVVKKSNEMSEFFNANNIQGFRGGKFAICLEYNNEIVMSYMMGNAYFGKGKYEWEVIRGATKLGYTVVGGASKIWKYFINNYNPKNCVYYIDYNYFNGNSLKNLPDMKFIKVQPSFKNYWIQENVVRNREPKRHKEIKELYKSKEVVPIYNAGTKVYVWENNQ